MVIRTNSRTGAKQVVRSYSGYKGSSSTSSSNSSKPLTKQNASIVASRSQPSTPRSSSSPSQPTEPLSSSAKISSNINDGKLSSNLPTVEPVGNLIGKGIGAFINYFKDAWADAADLEGTKTFELQLPGEGFFKKGLSSIVNKGVKERALKATIKKGAATPGLQGIVTMTDAERKLASLIPKGLSTSAIATTENEAQIIASFLSKPGTAPTNVVAKTSKNLIPKNTRVDMMLEKAAEKWMNSRPLQMSTKLKQLMTAENIVKFAKAFLYASGSTATISLWLRWEAAGGLGAATYASYENKDTSLMREVTTQMKEVLDMGFVDWIKTFTPIYGIADAFVNEGVKSVKTQIKVYTAIADDIDAQASGISEDEIWDARNMQKEIAAQQQRELDLINNQIRIDMNAKANDARLAANAVANDNRLAANAEAARKAAILNAKYWDDQLKKKAAYEEEQRRLNQEYWDAYFRKSAEMRNATTPSKLNFGLL